MGFLADSLGTALRLVLAPDPDVWHAAWTSLRIAAGSIVLAALPGIPLGLAAGLFEFPGRRAVVALLSSLMAVPTVLVGLLVYGLIGSRGPLGSLGLLFTPAGIVLGGTLLAGPIVASLTLAAAEGADRRILATARTLGAGPVRGALTVASEIRHGILAAVVAGFGRVVSEVGVAMMLGGNIRGYTRTMTTAIALETGKGEFALATGLGLVLLAVALAVNLLLELLRRRRR